jgi:hypothetical protein
VEQKHKTVSTRVGCFFWVEVLFLGRVGKNEMLFFAETHHRHTIQTTTMSETVSTATAAAATADTDSVITKPSVCARDYKVGSCYEITIKENPSGEPVTALFQKEVSGVYNCIDKRAPDGMINSSYFVATLKNETGKEISVFDTTPRNLPVVTLIPYYLGELGECMHCPVYGRMMPFVDPTNASLAKSEGRCFQVHALEIDFREDLVQLARLVRLTRAARNVPRDLEIKFQVYLIPSNTVLKRLKTV